MQYQVQRYSAPRALKVSASETVEFSASWRTASYHSSEQAAQEWVERQAQQDALFNLAVQRDCVRVVKVN